MIENRNLEKVLKERLFPRPSEIMFREGTCLLRNGLLVEISLPEPEKIGKIFFDYWGITVSLLYFDETNGKSPSGESYILDITQERIRIDAATLQSAGYALKTLRQLAEPVRGVKRLSGFIVQCCTIQDAPTCRFRGMHLCVFPETPPRHIEKLLRLAAYYKFNYIVLEAWGTFPFKSHPEFCWKGMTVPRSEFKHWLNVAAECGITVIPQFNVFGHASASRAYSGKHTILDFHRELQPLFEPSGWSFCLSNPETRKILTDIVTELHDFFGRPEFFHIGCDESFDFASCRECAIRDPEELIANHIAHFHELLARRGTRIMMWHDMLLDKKDPRWKGCTAFGKASTAKLFQRIPKDTVICDWEYFLPPETSPKHEWASTLFFQKQGFEVVVCPWQNPEGIAALGAMVSRHGLFGLLATTWDTAHGTMLVSQFRDTANAAWRGEASCQENIISLALHLRQICNDMGIDAYDLTGFCTVQISERPSV